MSYAVLGEDPSDTDTITCLIRRIANNDGLRVFKKGYSGAGELFNYGARQIQTYRDLHNCKKFVICFDSDGKDPAERKGKIVKDLIKAANIDATYCALIPVQEIEAWLLSDLHAVKKVLPGFNRMDEIRHPENIPNPKEHLEKLSRASNQRPRYINAVHNHNIAKHIDLKLLSQKCPSARPLFDMIKSNTGNIDL